MTVGWLAEANNNNIASFDLIRVDGKHPYTMPTEVTDKAPPEGGVVLSNEKEPSPLGDEIARVAFPHNVNSQLNRFAIHIPLTQATINLSAIIQCLFFSNGSANSCELFLLSKWFQKKDLCAGVMRLPVSQPITVNIYGIGSSHQIVVSIPS